MADLENGYTRIANEILEAIAKVKLSPTQYRILFVVWRYTYGFQRKTHQLSLTFLSEATDCDLRLIQRELKKLIDFNILLAEQKKGKTREIGFNKKISDWKIDVGKTTIGEIDNGETDNSAIGKTDNTAIGEIDNGTIGEIDNQERKKENSKDIIKESIFETYNNQNIVVHKSLTSKMKQAIDKALKKDSEENILEAIKRYGEAFSDPNYQFCKYKMTLDKFLTQSNGYTDWLDEGQKWINYSDFKNKGTSETRSPEQKNQTFKIKTKFHLAKSRGDKYSADELEQLILNNQKKRREGS